MHINKWLLWLLTFVPVPAGYLINLVTANSFLSGNTITGSFFYYCLPLAVLVFWFWLGCQFSKTTWSFWPSMLIGNMSGILSLILFVWQFFGHNDAIRNMFIAGLSQGFLCSTPMYLLSRISIMFDSDPNTIDIYDQLYVYIVSVVLMMAIFMLGYYYGIKSRKNNDKSVEAS